MNTYRLILLCTALAVPATAASAQSRVYQKIETVALPPSRQQGLDMLLIDTDAMPLEPEVAGDVAEAPEESWSGSPVDLMKPVHHLYTDFRRQLVRYQINWSSLPQVRVPETGAAIGRNSSDPRLPILRERLGLAREGGFDEALRAKLAAYQKAHGLKSDGIAGEGTVKSLNRGAAYYERLIMLNMERARRLPVVGAANKYILVDAGSARLWMYENGQPVDSMKVIVGTAQQETPMMAALLRYASVNPYWNVPPDLVQKLIAPRVLSEGNTYLKDRGYEVLESWQEDAQVVSPDTVDWRAVADGKDEIRVRQLPGAGNSMGDIKFMMPNDYGIYLHDTPNKALFSQDERWLSNGCIRLEDARRLAKWVFGDMPRPADTSRETRVDLAEPIPVYVTYLTAAPEKENLVFRGDPYQRDDAVLARFAASGDGMTDAQEVAVAEAPPKATHSPPVVKKTPTKGAVPAKAAEGNKTASEKTALTAGTAAKAQPVKAASTKPAASSKSPSAKTIADSKKPAPAKPSSKPAATGKKAVAR